MQSAREETAIIRGERFHFLEWGDAHAPVVLCLHGFPDVPRTWAPLAEGLVRAGYRVVAPWMRGYSPSTLRGPFDVDNLAADAVAFADHVSPNAPVRIVGHDWGAAVTYSALMLAPSRFSHAATLAVPHPLAFFRMLATDAGQMKRSWYMGFFQLPFVPEKTLARGNYHFVKEIWQAWSPDFAVSRDYLMEVRECLRASMPAPLGYYRSMAWPPRDALRRIREAKGAASRIRVPTIYLHGEDDACIAPPPRALHGRWFSGPHEEYVIPKAGHFVQQEQSQAVLDRLAVWFAR